MLRDRLWGVFKELLFRMDAERVHRLTVWIIRWGNRFPGKAPLRIASGAGQALDAGTVEVLGVRYRSRLGLAAGFDKDAEIVEALPELGFGFAEIGTVTPRPQPGNERPRLFREPLRQAIFNRMGFNGHGALLAAQRLAIARPKLPDGFRIGVNLGKNKDTPNEHAARDYGLAAAPFEGLADYLVINISSPNTPGLRALQTLEAVKPILETVQDAIRGWKFRPPIFLKLAPEVIGAALMEFVGAAESSGVEGWVLTNTLGGRFEVSQEKVLEGGWSGLPVIEASRESLRTVRSVSRKPIISVGGILSVEEAWKRVEMGADLVQIYSGWIFRGPAFPAEISRFLAEKSKHSSDR